MIREQHGLLKTDAEAQAFTARVKKTAEAALEAIWENESKLEREKNGSYQAQTDFVRMDVMVHYQDGELIPMIIEVNDHDSGGQIQIDELYPHNKGTHSREWVATAIDKARRYALKGKTIVMVGAGYEGKRFVFERARELGVKVVLVDRPGTWAEKLVSEFIPIKEGLSDEDAAKSALEELDARGLRAQVDGVTSVWEDDVPLTAKIAEELGTPYFSFSTAKIARNKSATNAVLKAAGMSAARSVNIPATRDDVRFQRALEEVRFPAVLKPASGAEAKLVIEVQNAEQARAAYEKILTEMPKIAAIDPAFIMEAGIDVVQFLDGPEVDVDVVVRDGKVIFDSVTDNWPTKRPYFLATGSNLPSRLKKKDQRALVGLAKQTVKALKLDNGVFHIEAKLTSEGPRIIEANARLGGTYVAQWVEAVWGVDLVKETLMAAAGIRGPVFKPAEPLKHLTGKFLIPDESGYLAKLDIADAARENRGFHDLRAFKKIGDRVDTPPNGNDRVGLLVAKGRDAKQADAALRELDDGVNVSLTAEAPGSDEYLQKRITTSPRGMKFAQFSKGEYKDEYAAKLKDMGVDVVSIRDPSREEIVSREENAGWYLQPRWVRWIRPVQTSEEFLADLSKSRRKSFRRLLRDNEDVPVEFKPLTPEDFEEWHPLYLKHVVGRKRAKWSGAGLSETGRTWAPCPWVSRRLTNTPRSALYPTPAISRSSTKRTN
jgi:carnosine synthase